MASSKDHLLWAKANEALAEELWESSDAARGRWAVVLAYYALLHIVHALADDVLSEHPGEHWEVREIVKRIEPTRPDLTARLHESFDLSRAARYLDEGAAAERWFDPYFTTEQDAVDRAMTLMRTIGPQLRTIGGWNAP